MMNKCYSELIKFPTYIERFRYLKEGLNGKVGENTFGSLRYLNQALYSSLEWKEFRNFIIIRDFGCDLGIIGREIFGKIIIHHINPLTPSDIQLKENCIFDPENVICMAYETHNALHYGDESLLIMEPIIRKPNDTCPWKR